ncbi:MAG: N-acetylmuramic acid 6-phosphate etherase [bacterium]|nr:N-acetylmuramic acid 6-phosphate etherase [bacterium]
MTEPTRGPRWRRLPTEARHAASRDLDTLPSEEIVALLLEEDRRGLDTALRHRRVIARAADAVADTLEAGGDVMFAGAGTSGRLGVIEAAECPPTFGTDPERIRAAIAGGQDAVFRAREGSEDRDGDGRRDVRGLGAGDLLIGVSASSVTPYVRGALNRAREQGARTVLLTCAAADGLDDLADLVLALDTGPEVLTGSTRLKAGSATKAVLNAVTTTAMVRLGKVFENLMVDLAQGSAKLRDRALRIVEAAGGVGLDEAESLWEAAGEEVKTAIVMARCRVSAPAAREQLKAAGGHVRQALVDAADGDD